MDIVQVFTYDLVCHVIVLKHTANIAEDVLIFLFMLRRVGNCFPVDVV
jgi:hypothetical protein